MNYILTSEFDNDGQRRNGDERAAKHFSVILYQSMVSSIRMPIMSFGSSSITADIVDIAFCNSILKLYSVGINCAGVVMDGASENRYIHIVIFLNQVRFTICQNSVSNFVCNLFQNVHAIQWSYVFQRYEFFRSVNWAQCS